MRIATFVLLLTLATAPLANAQSSVPSWEFGLGPHVVFRDDASHGGGGITLARRGQAMAAVFEGGVTRRQGHNDWRLIGGPRLMLGSPARSGFFVQALAGTLIRQRVADWAIMPGAGLDLRWTDASALRFQVDAPIERVESRTATSARASVWLIFR